MAISSRHLNLLGTRSRVRECSSGEALALVEIWPRLFFLFTDPIDPIMDWSFAFSDDDDDVLALTGVNRRSKVVRSGQMTLDGQRAAVSSRDDGSPIYEEIKETNVHYQPTHHEMNPDTAESIVYPNNLEVRAYQETIVKHALLENTLCALPTGLGKTLIASTVMLNFYRWFPQSKILFLAPTRPLVAQQMRACYGVVGLPLQDTAVLLDAPPKTRQKLWESCRVFFSTPQVVANDLAKGILDPITVVCLVIDEAHRAKGNYAYCNVAKLIYRVNTSFRVVALTATPGADAESVQGIIDTLGITRIEVRLDTDKDVAPYVNSKAVLKIDCPPTPEIERAVGFICRAALPILRKANAAGIYDITDPSRINQFRALEESRKVVANPNLAEGLKWTYYYQLRLLGEIGAFLRRLNVYGIPTFYRFFIQKYTEFTTKYNMKLSTNKTAAAFYFSEPVKELKRFAERLIENDKRRSMTSTTTVEGLFAHTKFQELVSRTSTFLQGSPKSSIIVFTEFRENALEIVKCLESANKLSDTDNLLRPHIFIGQAKEKDKFDEQQFRSKPRRRKGKKKDPTPKPRKSRGSTPAPDTRVGSSEDAQTHGMTQAAQKSLLAKFKAGTYNILVATSIGEEGLDIGEVDMIVCFDSTSSPIKNIQRMGRTGRKREGNVILLFSSNERTKFERAMDNYKWIQQKIRTNDIGLQLHASDRIIPRNVEPELIHQLIQIPEENLELLENSDSKNDESLLENAAIRTKSKGKRKGKQATLDSVRPKRKLAAAKESSPKRPAKIEKRFFMPKNVETGFRSVSAMVRRVDGKENEQPTAHKSTDEQPIEAHKPTNVHPVIDLTSFSDDELCSDDELAMLI